MYVLHRSPTKRLNGVTLEEAWSGTKPNVKHLRIFGAICYKHIHDQLRQKLNDKGELMVFLGYHETRGYRLFDPRSKQIAISRDVEFDEFKNWRLEPESTSRNARFLIEADYSGNNVVVTAVTPDQGILRKSTRVTQVPQSLRDYEVYKDDQITEGGDLVHLALYAGVEPIDVEEALQEPQWIQAMKKELSSIKKNNTWDLVNLPKGKRPIAVKWVFKVKKNPTGEVVKHKARLVTKGFLQRESVDYGEIFALVARIETIRLVATIASMRR